MIGVDAGTALSDRLLIPLRAIAHIRKAGLVMKTWRRTAPSGTGAGNLAELLRLMHTQRVALIDGQAIDLSPRSICSAAEDSGRRRWR